MRKKTSLILALLLPLQILLIRLISNYPLQIEKWYSEGLYPQLARIMRSVLGLLPFSFGDLLYTFFIVMLIRWVILRARSSFRNPLRWGTEALAALSIIYFCFHLFWGFNYYRLPLHKSLKIDNDYTTEELSRLTQKLIDKSNELQMEITGNDTIKVEMPYTKNELFDKTIDGYKNISTQFPELTYEGYSLKRSLYSIPLTYMGFNGYLNPLTNEAQVNTIIVPYKIPTTASHEIGHQLGFAKENEANFIACLTTMNHPDIYFRYSGFTFSLRYCLSELYRRAPEQAENLTSTINKGVLKNYQEVDQFWLHHQNPMEPLFQATYNRFLIANNQSGGMKSYSYVVALLVNYFEDTENSF